MVILGGSGLRRTFSPAGERPAFLGSRPLKKIHVGVVGCGFTGQQHLKAAARLDCVDVVAIADIDREKAGDAAEQFKVHKVCPNADVLLRDPKVEAVVLAVPTAGRSQLAIDALNAGKHVLLEKPAAMNAGEIRAMMAVRGELVCACCSARYRLTEVARVATEFVASGALGKLRLLRCRAAHGVGGPPKGPPPRWRVSRAINGGGILVNWGTYDLDFLLGVTGWSFVPKEALARIWKIAPHLSSHVAPDSDAESHFAALIQCEGGRAITLERGEFLAAANEDAWEIIGSHGSLRIDMTRVDGKWSVTHYWAAPEKGLVSRVLWAATEAEAARDDESLANGPLEDFIASIQERHPPRTGLEQALIITQITDAIYASAQCGGAATVGAPFGEPATVPTAGAGRGRELTCDLVSSRP